MPNIVGTFNYNNLHYIAVPVSDHKVVQIITLSIKPLDLQKKISFGQTSQSNDSSIYIQQVRLQTVIGS